ncbi:hypothetical protein ACJX0J_020078 [Zea mays]
MKWISILSECDNWGGGGGGGGTTECAYMFLKSSTFHCGYANWIVNLNVILDTYLTYDHIQLFFKNSSNIMLNFKILEALILELDIFLAEGAFICTTVGRRVYKGWGGVFEPSHGYTP